MDSARFSYAENSATMQQPTPYEHLQEYVTTRLPALGVGVFDENSDDPDFARDNTESVRLPVKPPIG